MENKKRTYSSKSVVTSIGCLSLIVPILVALSDQGCWWKNFIFAFVICYPYLCFAVQFVKFYDDCMIIIRPFHLLRLKKVISYNQIHYIREVTYGKSFPNLSPFDLYVYIRNKKHPVGIPMPFLDKNKEKLKVLIKSKEIKADWGLYE